MNGDGAGSGEGWWLYAVGREGCLDRCPVVGL